MARIFFIIWLFTKAQICPNSYFFAKVGLTLFQTLNKPSKVCLILLKVCPSGKISPNLVTLIVMPKSKSTQTNIATNAVRVSLLLAELRHACPALPRQQDVLSIEFVVIVVLKVVEKMLVRVVRRLLVVQEVLLLNLLPPGVVVVLGSVDAAALALLL